MFTNQNVLVESLLAVTFLKKGRESQLYYLETLHTEHFAIVIGDQISIYSFTTGLYELINNSRVSDIVNRDLSEIPNLVSYRHYHNSEVYAQVIKESYSPVFAHYMHAVLICAQMQFNQTIYNTCRDEKRVINTEA